MKNLVDFVEGSKEGYGILEEDHQFLFRAVFSSPDISKMYFRVLLFNSEGDSYWCRLPVNSTAWADQVFTFKTECYGPGNFVGSSHIEFYDFEGNCIMSRPLIRHFDLGIDDGFYYIYEFKFNRLTTKVY